MCNVSQFTCFGHEFDMKFDHFLTPNIIVNVLRNALFSVKNDPKNDQILTSKHVFLHQFYMKFECFVSFELES